MIGVCFFSYVFCPFLAVVSKDGLMFDTRFDFFYHFLPHLNFR